MVFIENLKVEDKNKIYISKKENCKSAADLYCTNCKQYIDYHNWYASCCIGGFFDNYTVTDFDIAYLCAVVDFF